MIPDNSCELNHHPAVRPRRSAVGARRGPGKKEGLGGQRKREERRRKGEVDHWKAGGGLCRSHTRMPPISAHLVFLVERQGLLFVDQHDDALLHGFARQLLIGWRIQVCAERERESGGG